jgi:Na+/proline symporter
MTQVDFFSFAILLSLFTLIGQFRRKGKNTETSYLVANRTTGLFALTCTLIMTEFNSGTLIAFSSLGYLAGNKALVFPGVFLIGLIFYALTVAKKWKEYDGISVAGVFTKTYGPAFGKMASCFLILAMVGFSAAYVKSLTLIFLPLFSNLSPWVVSGMLLAFVLFMTLRTGLPAIIRTDILSAMLTALAFPALVLFALKLPESPMPSNTIVLDVRFVSSLFMLTMFTYILAPWYGQKMFSARSKRVAYLAVIIAAVSVFVLYGLAVMATSIMRQKGVALPQAQLALPHLIHCALPGGVRGVFYALVFLSSATTLTGVWNALSGMLLHDFFAHRQNRQNPLQAALATVLFASISYLFANTLVDQVLDNMILANIPIAALSFALLAGFYWNKVSRKGAYASVVMGLLGGGGAYLYFGEQGIYTWYWASVGIPLSFVFGIVVSLKETTRVTN